MENVADEMIQAIQVTIATNEKEITKKRKALSECGLFDVFERQDLRRSIRLLEEEVGALNEELRPLLKTSLAQRQ